MNRLSTLRNLVVTLCFTIAGFSCSNDDDNERFSENNYPMTFSGSVEFLKATRATSEGRWIDEESVAIKISNQVKEHTAAANGMLTAKSGIDPFYWQSQAETKSVEAWYPYSITKPSSWSVQSNQSSTGYQQSDLLYTPVTNISFSGRESTLLNFYHQLAKVVVNINTDEAATNTDDITNIKIGENNLALSGDFAASVGNATQGTWTNLISMGSITPKDITSGSTNLKSYTALLIPQDMTNKKFIAVGLANGNTYYYTPNIGDATLEGGKQYTYNITVKNGYLEVEALTGGQWSDNGSEPITSKIVKTTYTATDLKPGDYYYSDGTTSDGGLRRMYADGSGTGAGSVSPTVGKTVIGIVFWTGDPTEGNHNNGTAFTDFGDPALKLEKVSCTHGLVVALQDASTNTLPWQSSSSDVGTWVSSNTSYETITTDKNATDALNKLRGYNNTQAIREYNNFLGNTSPNLVLPVQAIDNWAKSNTAPANSSGWYFPSDKELSLLCGRDVSDIWLNDSGGTGMRDIVNASLGKLGNEATTIRSGIYFSSLEFYLLANAFVLSFNSGYISPKSKAVNYNVRAVLAF